MAAIRDLRLPPGAVLSETDLARQLGVSRTPVREAFARLADAGLIRVVPQVGTKVARIRMVEAEEARFVRENLEIACLKIVCRLPDRDVTRLRRLIDEQQSAHAVHDLDAFFAADESMHVEIFAMSGFAGAWEAVQRKKLQLDRIRRLSLPEPTTIAELIGEHRAIVDAIEVGSTRNGIKTLRAHARRALLKAPELQQRYPDYFEQ